MCKHYNTSQGCSYGDKCQFAHGPQDLRSFSGQMGQNQMGDMSQGQQQKSQKNPLNYKIVKCKNFEKDGTCKYGTHCTFAHGANDLRSKADNYTQLQPNPNMMNPAFMYDYPMMPPMGLPQNFDINQLGGRQFRSKSNDDEYEPSNYGNGTGFDDEPTRSNWAKSSSASYSR